MNKFDINKMVNYLNINEYVLIKGCCDIKNLCTDINTQTSLKIKMLKDFNECAIKFMPFLNDDNVKNYDKKKYIAKKLQEDIDRGFNIFVLEMDKVSSEERCLTFQVAKSLNVLLVISLDSVSDRKPPRISHFKEIDSLDKAIEEQLCCNNGGSIRYRR